MPGGLTNTSGNMKNLGSFNEESIALFKEQCGDKFNFSESELDSIDFARCQRPDGSFYGTSGQCRKGKDVGTKEPEANSSKGGTKGSAKEKSPTEPKKSLRDRLKDKIKNTPLAKRLKKEMDESRDRREKIRKLEEGKKALKEMVRRAQGDWG